MVNAVAALVTMASSLARFGTVVCVQAAAAFRMAVTVQARAIVRPGLVQIVGRNAADLLVRAFGWRWLAPVPVWWVRFAVRLRGRRWLLYFKGR